MKKKSPVNESIDAVYSAAGNRIGYVVPRVGAAPNETNMIQSIYNAKGGNPSKMTYHKTVEDATAHLRALHDEDKKTAKPGEMHEQTRSKLAIIKEVIAESYIDEAKKTDKEEDEETSKAPSVEPTAYHWNKAKDVYDVPRTVTVKAIRGYGNHIKTGERLPLKDLVIAHARGLAKGAANFSSQFTPKQKRDYIRDKIAKRAAAKKAQEGSS